MWINFLALLGGCALLGVMGLFVVTLLDIILRVIQKVRRKYQIKHRFDKQPLAECYCVDCVWYTNYMNRCSKFDWGFPDNGFCSWAEPCSRDVTKGETND